MWDPESLQELMSYHLLIFFVIFQVVAVCNEAAMLALDENMEATLVSRKHFVAALQIVTPRTSQNYLQLCERYKNLTIKT